MYNPFKPVQKERRSEARMKFDEASKETQVILSSNRDKNDKINEILANLHKKRQRHVTR